MSTTFLRPRLTAFSPVGIGGPHLPAAERMFAVIIAAVLAGAALVTGLRGQAVDWPAFAVAFVACALMVAIGVYLRARKGAMRLAAAVVGFAVFMGFTGAAAIFIFALFPVSAPLIDPALIRMDAALGYDWAGFVTALAGWPLVGTTLGYVYMSSLPQMFGVLFLLAWLGRTTELYRFQLVGMVSITAIVCFWYVFPSIGPSAWASVTPQVQESIGLVFNADAGAELRRLAAQGVDVISPDRIMGVIAFPSFHIVMACMVVWFTRGTAAFVPAVVVNLAMVPATLAHGGHHLIDVLAGLVLFVLCVAVVNRVLPVAAPERPRAG